MKNTFSSLLIFLIFSFVISSCKKDPPIPPFRFYQGQGILSVGQSGLFYFDKDSLPIEIKFVKVISDSRCPIGFICKWQGEIVAEILINKTHTFRIASEEMNEKPVYYLGKHITIESATPYPIGHDKIKENEYKIEFNISK